MGEPSHLAEVLDRYMRERGYRLERLAKASNVPKQTIHHWLTGTVAAPYHWEPLLQVAAALRLPKVQANRLLQAAGQPPLNVLRQSLQDQKQPVIGRKRGLIFIVVFTNSS